MNSWQQPIAGEPGGATWHKVANPATGWFASKDSGWTADSFSSGLTVNFSSVVPVGTRAVKVSYRVSTTPADIWWRAGSDTNISNTPGASNEEAHRLPGIIGNNSPTAIWLSATYTADFAVGDVGLDLYISYPSEYLL